MKADAKCKSCYGTGIYGLRVLSRRQADKVRRSPRAHLLLNGDRLLIVCTCVVDEPEPEKPPVEAGGSVRA